MPKVSKHILFVGKKSGRLRIVARDGTDHSGKKSPARDAALQPAQLPPVKGAGFFVSDEPDVMLTEIHRQAFDNPIIRMSMLVREGGRQVAGSYGDSALADEPDQILAGRNVTRHSINARERKKRGRKGVLPCAGDKLVCLRNNYRQGLLNGAIWVAHEVHTSASGVHMVVVPEDDDGGGRDRSHDPRRVLHGRRGKTAVASPA